MTDLRDLSERLTMFIKDLDYYDYMDNPEFDETDEDMIEEHRAMLEEPSQVRSAVSVLEEIMRDGTIDESETKERARCQNLINELKNLYAEQMRCQKKMVQERRAR